MPASFISVDEVRCLSPEVLPSFTGVFKQASVRVTSNGVDWSADSATFTYFTHPVVSGLSPKAGDRAASHTLTVRGDHFFELRSADSLAYGAQGAYNLFCKFGLDECEGEICGANVPATFVDQQTLRCDTPVVPTISSQPVLISVISPTSPLHLPSISPTSAQYLLCISPTSAQYLPYISPASPLHLPGEPRLHVLRSRHRAHLHLLRAPPAADHRATGARVR